MSDAQFGILVSVLGAGLSGLIGVIKWSVGRVMKTVDDNTSAMLENTKSNAILSTKIDSISTYIHTTPPGGVPKKRAKTNPSISTSEGENE